MKTSSFIWNNADAVIPTALLIVLVFFSGMKMDAQEDIDTQEDRTVEPDIRPVKNSFESIWLMDHQTVMVPIKGTFEMDFQHRFGTWKKGYDDFYGVFAPSNIRIGFDYTPVDRLMVGFGFTKKDLIWDLNAKYALLRQGKGGGSPVSLTYYVNAAVDTRKLEKTPFSEKSDRWSFYHQLMLARKVTEDFSLQVSGSLSWFNFKEQVLDPEGIDLGRDENAHFAIGVLARYKISNVIAIIAAYDHPVTDPMFIDPEPNLSFGLEMVSSSHAFQIFVGNYQSLVPQYNSTYNENSFGDDEILIGFNITRLWNF
jgi:hypothetical protein